MKLNKKLIAAAVLSTATISGGAYAIDQDIDASAVFRAGLSIANVVAMDYGTIEFGASAGSATFTLDATDASITNSDSANYTAPASGTRGALELEGTTGLGVDISCSTTGTLANVAGDDTISLDNTEINFNAGSDNACAGLGTSPVSVTLTSGTDTVLVGGRLNLSSAPNAEAYSTANTNGVAIVVRAIYN